MLTTETAKNPSIKRLALDPRKNVRLPLTQAAVDRRVQLGINPLMDRGGLSVARWLTGGRRISR